MAPIYSNETYSVYNGTENDTKNYKVINNANGNIEYTSDMLVEALRICDLFDQGLAQFYSKYDGVTEADDWGDFTVN
jgi:hypothetical protein